MAYFGLKTLDSASVSARAAIKNIVLSNGSLLGKDDLYGFCGLEALSDRRKMPEFLDKVGVVVDVLKRDPAITTWVTGLATPDRNAVYFGTNAAQSVAGMESIRDSWVDDAFQTLAVSLMSQMSPHETVKQYNNICPQAGSERIAHSFQGAPSLAGLDNPTWGEKWGLESFDPIQHLDFIAASAMINAQTSIPGGFEDTWFPAISLPPGQAGYDVQIQVPKILITRYRNTSSGAPMLLQKVNLVEAAYNPSIMASNGIDIIPIAISATEPAQLVVEALVPAWEKEILGEKMKTRPIIFGEEVGLIELATFKGIENGGTMDTTDALYTNIGIKDIYFKVTVTTGKNTATPVVKSAVIKNDVTNVVGTLLQQKTLGRPQGLQTTTEAPLYLSSDFTPVSGDTNADVIGAIRNIMGLAASAKFTLQGVVRLSATADTEIGSMVVDQAQPKVVSAFGPVKSGQLPITYDISTLDSAATSVTITMVGWYPSAKRTNSNLRTNGTIIDASNVVNYRLPINVFPPFTARTALNTTDQITFETLANVTQLWVSGQCVEKLLQMEDWLTEVSGTPMGVGVMTNQCPIMGGEFVIPTLRKDFVDLQSLCKNWQSKDTLANIRATIQTSIMYNSLALYMESGYSSAMQMLLSDLDAYETIIVTDPLIAQYFMEPGDIRTFGDNRKYIITKSNNKDIRGKVYYSFRLVGSGDLVHPMSFGCRLQSPNITYEVVPMARSGATYREIQSMPRVVPYANLPVLGVLLIRGLDTFASSPAQ
jgi:hypothetical protein